MAEQNISRHDRELAARALRKRRAGHKPTRQESAALRRIEKAEEERRRWEYYATIPKGHYNQLSGRPTKVLNEQAERYGIPIGGKTVNLGEVLFWLHDFLKKNRNKLATTEGEDPMSGEISPALERWREEKYLLARLERLERENKLLPRDLVHDGLALMATILRRLGENMQKHHGSDAHQLVDEALDDWERQVSALFPADDCCGDNEPKRSQG